MRKISKNTKILLITGVIILMVMSGCSITAERHFERKISPSSICWQDDEHFLVYCSIEQYYFTPNFVGNDDIHYDWAGGEIWRVNALNGNTELLFVQQSSEYYTSSLNGVTIDVANNRIYISTDFHTYRINTDYSGWEQMTDSIVYPVVSSDERYIVGMRHGGDAVKYDTKTKSTELLVLDSGPVSDYDYSRNLLLINNIVLINLNTMDSITLIEDREIIDSIRIYSIESAINGVITDNSIIFDVDSNKVFIDIYSLSNKRLQRGLFGILNPSRYYIARDGDIIDTLGNVISEYELSSTEL